jgi:hypothetical protein
VTLGGVPGIPAHTLGEEIPRIVTAVEDLDALLEASRNNGDDGGAVFLNYTNKRGIENVVADYLGGFTEYTDIAVNGFLYHSFLFLLGNEPRNGSARLFVGGEPNSDLVAVGVAVVKTGLDDLLVIVKGVLDKHGYPEAERVTDVPLPLVDGTGVRSVNKIEDHFFLPFFALSVKNSLSKKDEKVNMNKTIAIMKKTIAIYDNI